MDWETQPSPFRSFVGSPRRPLALRDIEEGPRYEAALQEGSIPSVPVSLQSISQLFQDSLGLSAWKEAGEARWALRVNPSSGNLHPTEGYLVCPAIEGLSDRPGVWHYQPHDHALEQRCSLPSDWWEALLEQLPPGTLLVGISSIYVRESWKYGERAFRYCQHDVGHALAALGIAAAGLGWTTRLLESVTDVELEALLGLAAQKGPEAEHPDLLLAVFPQGSDFEDTRWQAFRLPPLPAATEWLGEPNSLAESHHDWPVIDEVHRATWKTEQPTGDFWSPTRLSSTSLVQGDSAMLLRTIVHQRRSAVDMDGHSSVHLEDFIQTLSRLLPGAEHVPLTALPWRPHIHLLVFVHRVQGLDPGIYCLVRDPLALPQLRQALWPEAPWTQPESCAPLPLYLLSKGDCRHYAASVSCGQAIAGNGVFACAMLGEFRGALEAWGPWFYKRLHWEAGLIGQLLYLEAEAIGIRATGIGCFFDNETHRVGHLTGDDFQDIYHFTLGGAVEDERLVTLPPYAHLTPEASTLADDSQH
jgi:SagB-type dehydrogenase family enzyme